MPRSHRSRVAAVTIYRYSGFTLHSMRFTGVAHLKARNGREIGNAAGGRASFVREEAMAGH